MLGRGHKKTISDSEPGPGMYIPEKYGETGANGPSYSISAVKGMNTMTTVNDVPGPGKYVPKHIEPIPGFV